jgi:hypothetical protein
VSGRGLLLLSHRNLPHRKPKSPCEKERNGIYYEHKCKCEECGGEGDSGKK